jgi:hypothetical protein
MPEDEIKYTLMIFIVFAATLWAAAFYRLKEKEV